MAATQNPIESSESKQPDKPRRNLSRERTDILKRWYRSHVLTPYPSNVDKLLLAQMTVRPPSYPFTAEQGALVDDSGWFQGISVEQVQQW